MLASERQLCSDDTVRDQISGSTNCAEFRGHNTNFEGVFLTLGGRAGRFMTWHDWRELWFREWRTT
jgi:hypothetical protein